MTELMETKVRTGQTANTDLTDTMVSKELTKQTATTELNRDEDEDWADGDFSADGVDGEDGADGADGDDGAEGDDAVAAVGVVSPVLCLQSSTGVTHERQRT